MNKQLFERILDLAGQPLLENVDATEEEYVEAVSKYYSEDLMAFIKGGEDMAQSMASGNEIQTEKSDNGNIIVRWVEDENNIVVLGLVSKSGSFKRSDLPDFKYWTNNLTDKIKSGMTLYTSPNDLSGPLLKKIIKRMERDGTELDIEEHGSFTFDDKTWKTISVKKR